MTVVNQFKKQKVKAIGKPISFNYFNKKSCLTKKLQTLDHAEATTQLLFIHTSGKGTVLRCL